MTTSKKHSIVIQKFVFLNALSKQRFINNSSYLNIHYLYNFVLIFIGLSLLIKAFFVPILIHDLIFRSSGFDELDMVGGNLFMVKKCEDEDYVIRHLK